MKLSSSVRNVDSLCVDERNVMYQLMEENYANMQRRQFDADLDNKKWVILVRCPDSLQIVGFSTQVMLAVQIGGESVHALYSGDTVVQRDYWGDPALAHAWGNFALDLIDCYSHEQLYWFLTSKGFRTYRYLPLFFRDFFPRVDYPPGEWESTLIDAFGHHVKGGTYDVTHKIIRAVDGMDFVRPGIAEPGMRLNTDRHVRFFAERNPRFDRGDELCCLAPLSRDNFTRVACRVIGSRCQPLSTV